MVDLLLMGMGDLQGRHWKKCGKCLIFTKYP